MKKIILAFLTTALFTACQSGGKESGKTELKIGHAMTETHPTHLAMKRFGELVAEKTDGEVIVTIFPNGQLGGERELIELMQVGAIDMTKTGAALVESFSKDFSVLSLPFLFEGKDHQTRILKGDIGEELLGITANKGFIGLTYYDAGSRNFYASKPINSPDDLKGMKIRVQPSNTAIRMVESLGASPTPLGWGELYTALQQKVVDGAENNLISYIDAKHSEVAKYFTWDEHSMSPDVFLISSSTWKKLGPEKQKLVKEAAMESFDYQMDVWAAQEQGEMEKAKAAGVNFIYPDKAPFREKVGKLYEDVKKDPVMADYITRIQSN